MATESNPAAPEGESTEQILGNLLRERGATLAVAESCTGGLIAGRITAVAGSSDYFAGGVIAYDNRVKIRQLGVAAALIARHGAVSEEVARAMAEGVRKRFQTDYAVSVTGVAGPGGGTPEKPVGTIWLGLAGPNGTVAAKWTLPGGRRHEIRAQTVQCALDGLRRILVENSG